MEKEKYSLGMIGLGTMGRNLLLNMADHGYAVAGYDKDPAKVEMLKKEGAEKPLSGFSSVEDFIASLESPKVIMLLVPAGKIVDAVINEIQDLLPPDAIIVDGGNSHFTDTDRRVKQLAEKKLHFFGMGISGGEEGARFGPSMMPGGDTKAYQFMKPILESVAAKVNGEPCVTYIGPGASGHFVKMVHNGIEYALMQLLADTYEILKKGLGQSNPQIAERLKEWNEGRLHSYLVEITARIFTYQTPEKTYLLDQILDVARSKGTGKWTTQIATELELPIPTIDIAVAMRDLSKYEEIRSTAAANWPAPTTIPAGFLNKLEEAYYFSMIMIYAQGMHLLARASDVYGYQLDLAAISRIWRGGCIIRAAFLEDMYQAFRRNPKLQHLVLDTPIQQHLQSAVPAARELAAALLTAGISAPAFINAVSYFDALRTGMLSTNLIQAQRDFFGAHTYELRGKTGNFHTEWTAQ